MRAGNILDLIGNIYDSALDLRSWDETLNGLSDACHAHCAYFHFFDPFTKGATVISPRLDPDLEREYETYWWAHNPLINHGDDAPLGVAFALQERISIAEFKRTAIYNDYLRRTEVGASYIAARLTGRPGDQARAGCVLHPYRGREDFEAGTMETFASLLPHLVRAARMIEVLGAKEQVAAMAALRGERAAAGAVLVDRWLRVVRLEDEAAALIAACPSLRLKSGVLEATSSLITGHLARMVGRCLDPVPGKAPGGRLRLDGNEGRAGLEIEVIPWRGGETSLPAHPRPAAILLLLDGRLERSRQEASLRERFGLTERESCLAVEILKGDGREAAAGRLGISVSTARMHLSNIFEKTGVHRQAELVRLLLGDGTVE